MLRVTTIHASTAGASARYYTRYLADDGPENEGQWLGPAGAESRTHRDVYRRTISSRSCRDTIPLPGYGSAPRSSTVSMRRDGSSRPWLGSTRPSPRRSRCPSGGLSPAITECSTRTTPRSVPCWSTSSDTARRHVSVSTAQRQHPDASGLVMAAFRQSTSREDDPQIHTHVVDLHQGADAGRPVDGARRPLPEAQAARPRRPLPVGAARRAHPPLRRRLGAGRSTGRPRSPACPRNCSTRSRSGPSRSTPPSPQKVTEFRDREGRDPSRWERAALDPRSGRGHT